MLRYTRKATAVTASRADSREARSAYQPLNLLADGQSVIAARIETGIIKERCQEFGHCDAGPYHNNGH